MHPGQVIDDRFEIGRLIGTGGMGRVYRAIDRRSGGPVALKVLLHSAGAPELQRFRREAEALAALSLPGVVQYIAHGVAAEQPYLAMEWLPGETLSQRLERQPLTVAESVGVMEGVARTLGLIHQQGMVHRDVKPSNLMLVDGALERVTLLDFGLVRREAGDGSLTGPGGLLGTPGYMAPEQARGARTVDARADVFALGCVLYKCLTGRAAFQGEHALAVLAKVLFEEPPQPSALRPGVPAPLDALVARMLAKKPDDRPRDGAAVAAELVALATHERGAGEAFAADSFLPVSELTSSERKVMCIVLAGVGTASADATRSEAEMEERAKAISAHVLRCRGRLELALGTLPLVVFSEASAPIDLAARAARCALELQSLLEGAPVALVTGRAEVAAELPVGALIDHALELLHHEREAGCLPAVRVDAVTAGLVGARFETSAEGEGFWLRGAAPTDDGTPRLLGRPTGCIGRERELALLSAEFSRCVADATPSALLVTAEAGMGKSRLVHELIRSLEERGEPVEVWIGHADPMNAGSAFSLLVSALRRVFGFVDGEPAEARRRKIRGRVARHPRLDVDRVAAFLGELLGAPFPDDDIQLRAARQSPMSMGDQIRVAWEDFLQAECAASPVLLVLEDLHWGDLPTVTMVERALRNLGDSPFLVVALSRPEVHELFPKLWQRHLAHDLRLLPLTTKASERLVRSSLGPEVGAELVAKLVDRAQGNVFYLQELIRAAAQGKTEGSPETVLAMVQAGFEVLDVETRRALRAASLFGERFSEGGVAALVGRVEVQPLLLALEQREVIASERAGAPAAERVYRFRHALVREAAYAMLTERDRQVGHLLAGEWLERSGDADPIALAEHFERGGQPARAAAAFLSAAEQALRGDDLVTALARAERGVACAQEPTTVGALRLVQAEAHRWRGEFGLAEQRAVEAAERLAPGSAAWFRASNEAQLAAGKLGAFDRAVDWLKRTAETDAQDGALLARNICLAELALYLIFHGEFALTKTTIDAIERTALDVRAYDAAIEALLQEVRSVLAALAGDIGAATEHKVVAVATFEQAGDRRNACRARINLCCHYICIGDFEAAEAGLRTSLAEAQRLGLHDLIAHAYSNLGPALAGLGQLADGLAAEMEAIALYERTGDTRLEGASRIYLAQIHLSAGDLPSAEREARTAMELLRHVPPLRPYAGAILASVLLELGRREEALEAACEAFSILESVGAEEGESLIRLVYAEALRAAGRDADARAALASAKGVLLARADKLPDPAMRQRFLQVPENARTLALARDLVV